MPRSVLITTSVLVILAGIGGYWLGTQRTALEDATGIIEAVAADHVARHGGAKSACEGWLREDGKALYVRCGTVLYAVDAWGRVRAVEEDGI